MNPQHHHQDEGKENWQLGLLSKLAFSLLHGVLVGVSAYISHHLSSTCIRPVMGDSPPSFAQSLKDAHILK